ncbi:MAG: amidohydrolase family protein [Bacteroidota bacterium]
MKFTLLILTVLVWCTVEVQAQTDGCFQIENVRIFQNGQFKEDMDLLVEGELIVEVASEIKSDCQTIDGSGYTLLPGLVNAHVHAWIPYHLKNAVNFGVYTLQDMHSLNETTASLKDLGQQHGFAKLYGAGYAATVEKGHGTQFGYEVPVINKERSCYDFVDQQVAAGVDHIKIIFEPAAATLTIAQIDSLIQRTHKHGKKAVVHISNLEDALSVIRLGADGLVHIWRDRPMTDIELEEVASSGVFIVPTLTVLEKSAAYLKKKRITYKRMSEKELLDEVFKLYEAGVTILAGTDPPNFQLDYGKSLHHELALLRASGIPATDVLKSATSNPYQVYGYRYNDIETGEKASFFMVEGDPQSDIKQTENILFRWMNGKIVNELNDY